MACSILHHIIYVTFLISALILEKLNQHADKCARESTNVKYPPAAIVFTCVIFTLTVKPKFDPHLTGGRVVYKLILDNIFKIEKLKKYLSQSSMLLKPRLKWFEK